MGPTPCILCFTSLQAVSCLVSRHGRSLRRLGVDALSYMGRAASVSLPIRLGFTWQDNNHNAIPAGAAPDAAAAVGVFRRDRFLNQVRHAVLWVHISKLTLYGVSFTQEHGWVLLTLRYSLYRYDRYFLGTSDAALPGLMCVDRARFLFPVQVDAVTSELLELPKLSSYSHLQYAPSRNRQYHLLTATERPDTRR